MREGESRFLFPLLIGGLFVLGASCTTNPLNPPKLSKDSLFLGPTPSLQDNRPFQKALKCEPGTRALEQARMDYLLERVSESPYNFFRNGSRYPGKRAEEHLKWKLLRDLGRVKTAEDFIEQVATYSKMSSQSYLVILPDGVRRPLRPFLVNELEVFDRAVEEERMRIPPLPKESQS